MAPRYQSSSGDELDQSSPPSKRRKISPTPSSRKQPLSSRVLKSIKEAVVGKPLELNRDTTASDLTNAWNDEPDELGDEEGAVSATPTKVSQSGRPKKATKVQVVTGAGTVANTTIALEQTPSKTRPKKFKGWQYLKEGEDVGINNQDAFAKIAEEAAKKMAKENDEDVEESIASNLRERRPRLPSTPLRTPVKKDASTDKYRQKRKGILGEKPSSKDAGKEVEEGGSSRPRHVLMGAGSLDEIHDGVSLDHEVSPIRLKTLKKNQSISGKRESPRATNADEVQSPNSQPDPLDSPNGSRRHLKGALSESISSKTLATKKSADSCLTTALQPEEHTDAPQDLLKDASHVESILSNFPTALSVIKSQVIQQLTCKSRLPILPNHSNDYETVHQLLSRTVQAGEGNSMLLIGTRGSGKSALVEAALAELTESNGDDFYVVRLNGFIHTDDRIALKEIWRQLGKELEGEDDGTSLRNNYADTLTSLLALLSHQDESQAEGGEQSLASRSVIFVLDEFDLFAQHPRQTLLYNLFDVAQSHRNAPIAVLGLTTKVHVVDSLEKRVKSRFSQRSIHLSPPKDFQTFRDVCLEALKYHNPVTSTPSSFKARLKHHGSVDHQPLKDASQGDAVVLPEHVVEAWNAYASAILSTAYVTRLLHTYYTTSKRPSDFHTAIALPLIYALNPSNLSSSIISTSSSSSSSSIPSTASVSALTTVPDSKLALLPALSTLQLSLLIAACRLEIILSTDLCSFDMAYEEYLALIKKSKLLHSGMSSSSSSGPFASAGAGAGAGARGYGVARGAWLELEAVGLLMPSSTTTTGSLGDGGKGWNGRWRVDVSLEEVGAWLEGEGKVAAAGGGVMGLGKWCREI